MPAPPVAFHPGRFALVSESDVRFEEYIIDDSFPLGAVGLLLGVSQVDVGDGHAVAEQGVEEAYENMLPLFGCEEPLESEVCA